MLQSTGDARGTEVTMCEFWLFLSVAFVFTLGPSSGGGNLEEGSEAPKVQMEGKFLACN